MRFSGIIWMRQAHEEGLVVAERKPRQARLKIVATVSTETHAHDQANRTPVRGWRLTD